MKSRRNEASICLACCCMQLRIGTTKIKKKPTVRAGFFKTRIVLFLALFLADEVSGAKAHQDGDAAAERGGLVGL